MDRPITTLFLLMSVDGKISTGSTDEMDVDKDFPTIDGVKQGLHQYYEIEQTTDLWSFCTGRVQAKVGINKIKEINKTPVNFVILDNHHLTRQGVLNLCKKANHFVLLTSNRKHPAFEIEEDNMDVLYEEEISFSNIFEILKKRFACKRLTVQSGGTINSILLREKLIDYVDIVVAPVLIGGKDTASLIDGPSLTSDSELSKLGVLKLLECITLDDSYIRLRYQVLS